MSYFNLIGVMSGTSLDGMDAVLISVDPRSHPWKILIRAHDFKPYSQKFRKTIQRVIAKNSLSDAIFLGAHWAEEAASLVHHLVSKARISKSNILAIGAHGQTLFHLPHPVVVHGRPISVTYQMGDFSRLAVRSGIPVVGNFRTADMAAYGQGAPLVPHAHRILFGQFRSLLVQNIGGIGNVTMIRNGKLLGAFDTGPGNCWIDQVVRFKTKEKLHFDRHGAAAYRGSPDMKVVRKLLKHPYFQKEPPKSTGWEEFGQHSLRAVWPSLIRMNFDDAVATVTEATVRALAQSYHRYIFPKFNPRKLVVCGGGAYNKTLIGRLQALLPELSVLTSDELGVPATQVEAISFALLALRTLKGEPNNEPQATGARMLVIGGEITQGIHRKLFDTLATLRQR